MNECFLVDYYWLTKPGIILGNLFSAGIGFFLASKGVMNERLLFATLMGLALIMASACVCNNYIDRNFDRKMKRTQARALPKGLVSELQALSFAIFLGILGSFILFLYTPALTLMTAGIGFFVYVILYSFWKAHTPYGTVIGSIAGALPPIIGYCAAGAPLDIGALLLFAMMVLWQLPHFFAIALFHFDDYAAAKIPSFPIQRGILRTKIHIALYILGFTLTATLLTLFHYTGSLVLIIAISMGAIWMGLCIKGFNTSHHSQWGRQMFRFSLVMLASLYLAIVLDTK